MLQRALRYVLELNPSLLPAGLQAPQDQPRLLAATQSPETLQQLLLEHTELARALAKFQAIGPDAAHSTVASALAGQRYVASASATADGAVRVGHAPHPAAGHGKQAAHGAPAGTHGPAFQVRAPASCDVSQCSLPMTSCVRRRGLCAAAAGLARYG